MKYLIVLFLCVGIASAQVQPYPPTNGTVSAVTGVNANGATVSVATSTTTPAITVGTSLSGPLKGNGTAFQAAAASDIYNLFSGTPSATCYLSGSGACSVPAGTVITSANPSATIGLSVVNGTAGTFMTSDSAPALSQAIVPTWTGAHTFNAGLSTTTLAVSSTTTYTYGTSYSAATWGTTSPLNNVVAATLNDTTTGSGGVNMDAELSIQAPTITNSQGTANVLTNAIALYIASPVCGSGWASCTNLYSIYAAGQIRAAGITSTALVTSTAGATISGATINLNNNSNNTTSINTGTGTGALHLGDGSGNNTITIGNGTGVDTIAGPFTASNATVKLSGIASSSSAQTGTVCSGTGGLLTVDTTTTCLASDGRHKMNVEPLDVGLAEIMLLKPVSYELKPDVNPTHLGRQVGLIAQDVIKVDPRLASVYQSGPDEGTPSGVRYEQMVALLVKGMQEQQHEIDALKRRIKH